MLSTGIETPVPGSEDQDVGDPKRARGAQQRQRPELVAGQGADEQVEGPEHLCRDHAQEDISERLIKGEGTP